MILYAITIFLSAFLLFQVQPLIAKVILPWFGGSAAVWTVCMLFFQVLLLAGYVYSHAYVRLRIPARRHIHIALLALAAATLPLAAGAAWKPAGGEDPTWRILGLLATSVGLPYFALSTTGPLVQAWYASLLLLAFTGHMTLNIAAIPFLWVLPLALYLLSFVLCFEASGWYRRWLFLPLLTAGFAGVCVTLTRSNPSIWTLIPLYCATLFAACMVCHGELARSKPHPQHLTGFYLMLALGGAAGGVLAGLVAPNVFEDLYELPIGMLALSLLVIAALLRDRASLLHGRFGIAARIASLALAAALAVTLYRTYAENSADTRVRSRNFYGVLNVHDSGEGPDAMRILSHGTIVHGKQFLDPDRRGLPTSYYGPRSGIGLALLDARAHGPLRVGVVGLGAGTLAAYGRAGDVFRFYDINSGVVELARSEFTFLKDSPAKVEVALGDARLSLERERPQNFDVLALDAFSSDAIPVHLLTVEAFKTYLRHLKPGGVLAVHISNRYLDLVPVVQQAGRRLSLEVRQVESDDDDEAGVYRSDWMLLSASPAPFEGELLKEAAERIDAVPRVRLWTDDYSDVYRILK